MLRKLADGTDIALVRMQARRWSPTPASGSSPRPLQEGVRVVPIPGASAVLAALAVSGFPADEFVFAGFAPSRSNDRKRWLACFLRSKRTVVFFEAPHRIQERWQKWLLFWAIRPITIARELTKAARAGCPYDSASAGAALSYPKRASSRLCSRRDSCPVDEPQTVLTIKDFDYFYQLTDNQSFPAPRCAE